MDFGLRAGRLGFCTRTLREATVVHAIDDLATLGSVAAKLYTYGRADVELRSRHSNRRRARANRPALLLLAAFVGNRGRTARGLVVLVVLCVLTARDVCQRRATRPAEPIAVLTVGSLLQWSFDLGVLRQAVGRGNPLAAFSRFAYVRPGEAQPGTPVGSSSWVRMLGVEDRPRR